MLYAFDGTWNEDKPGGENDTNVFKFAEAYGDGDGAFYLPGVGTRFGIAGEVAGGITGAGGRTRVKEALRTLADRISQGDRVVDVVGFSRGSALALHFCNAVQDSHPALEIRFLGLWDCVPSFGAPSIDWNIGWDLDLPDNVRKCYHALALDERRHTFHLHRLSASVESSGQEGRLFEVWFRGVHSDVGGGNDNHGLSSITLNWMFKKALSCQLPMAAAKIAGNAARMQPGCTPSRSPWYDLIKQAYRAVRWDDDIHASVVYDPKDKCNNPPDGADLVDDDGPVKDRKFRRV
jgi:uncharacterized protein (DUF2235 family)